ncbi:MAG: PAS domain S-box protein, partial [Syntrophobacterales bacterium]
MKNRDHTPQKPKDLPRRTEEPPRPHKSPKTRPSAEAALFQDQEKYRLLAESSPLGIAVVDVNGRYTYLNPKFVEMFGYALDDIHTGREWFAKAYPDAAYRARILSDWKLYVQESQAGEAQPRVFTVTCKDGSAKVIKFRGVPLENGEQVIFYEDITQRKELEEALQESKAHYRTLFETTPDAISLFDTDLKLIKANQAAANLYGVERPEEMLGRSSHEFVAPESLALAQELNQKALSTENIIEAEFVLLKSDGSPFIAETRTSILRNSGGSPKAFLAVAKDITERKQYEEKLLQAKEEWERTFNAIPDLVMILDNQYRIVRVNQTMAHRYGCDPEEMVGKFCYQLIHDLEAPPPFCPSSAMLSHGQPVQLETWDQKLESYLLITTSPIYDPSGRIMGSVQVGTDITERKLAEEALRKSEEKYRLLVGQIPAVVFKGYEDWSIECFDDKIETLTGYSKEDFNRRRLTWRDLIVTEDLPYVKDVFHKALAGDGAYFREHRIKKKSDELAWVQCRGQIVRDEKGAVEYISGVTFDITAHKEAEAALRESEERYRLIAENVSDVIWTANLDLVSTYISPSVQHLLGFTPEEIIGRSLGEFLPPASLGRALEVLSEEMVKEEQGHADPNRSRMLELEELHKDGYSIQTEVKASFIRGAYNQPIGILGVTRDITKRKEAEEALLRRDAVLEAVSFAAEKFLKTRFWEEDIQKILE